jgi:hypothetical protein
MSLSPACVVNQIPGFSVPEGLRYEACLSLGRSAWSEPSSISDGLMASYARSNAQSQRRRESQVQIMVQEEEKTKTQGKVSSSEAGEEERNRKWNSAS